MGGICADSMRQPNFSSNNDYDSSEDYFEDDDSDVQSFVSNRSFKHRDRRVKRRKTPYPSEIPDLPYARSAEENSVEGRRSNPRIEAKTVDFTSYAPNVAGEHSQKSEAILVSSDDDMKKQIKELMEPFLFKRVQTIVDQTVDELFMKVNSSDVLSSGSKKRTYLNQKRDSVISSVASSAADTKHSRREFENINRDGTDSKASFLTPRKLLLNEQLNNGGIDDISDISDDRSIKQPSLPQIQVLGNFDDKRHGRRISCLKLDQIACLRGLELKSGEISQISADSLEKLAVQPDHIRGQVSRVSSFEADKKVIEVQRPYSTNSLNAKMSSRESTPNVLAKSQNEGSEMTGSSSMSLSVK